jgi:glycosyltransferase involved in cell wall biosynthesis
MKIGIFAPMTGRQAGGPEAYDTGLVRGLMAVGAPHEYTVYCVNEAGATLMRRAAPAHATVVLRPSRRWISIPVSLPIALGRAGVDLVHATFVAPPFLPAPLVFTLLDISPVTHPQFLPWSLRLRLWPLWRNSLRMARVVLCISEFTRQCLIEALGFPPDRAFVSHLGVHPRFRVIEPDATRATLSRYGVTAPYVLHVGKIQARKNIVRLLEAFHMVKRDLSLPHKLVLVGRKTWTSSEVEPLIARLGLAPHIVQTGHVADEDTPHFYNGASALAYPSLYEGFGLPVIEAMSCGTPVVTSNGTSLPEIAGDAAVLVDPYRVEDIATGLSRVLQDSALAEALRRRGLERSREFRWERTAQRTLEAYARATEL